MEQIQQTMWPALPLDEWQETYDTLHLWAQIVGKVRLALAPPLNHWWNAALYVSECGLTTSPIPYQGRAFSMEFNFIEHQLEFRVSDGGQRALALKPRSVAAFYREVLAILHGFGIYVEINPMPQEIPGAIPLDEDETHASYDAEYANRCWRILLSSSLVLQEFRGRFLGKSSHVHFFWGSFDLALTRFSGRRAPARKGIITAEAYSHECSSIGWWPGGGDIKAPAFYAYAAPAPAGLGSQKVKPAAASYQEKLGEFLLMYDDVRQAQSPRQEILAFAQSAYEAGANLAGWDRATLDEPFEATDKAKTA
jgi:hypothetical protein